MHMETNPTPSKLSLALAALAGILKLYGNTPHITISTVGGGRVSGRYVGKSDDTITIDVPRYDGETTYPMTIDLVRVVGIEHAKADIERHDLDNGDVASVAYDGRVAYFRRADRRTFIATQRMHDYHVIAAWWQARKDDSASFAARIAAGV